MSLLRHAIALTVFATLAGCQYVPSKTNNPSDIAAIEQVVATFKSSITKKDKPAFMGLFFSDKAEDITWQFVVDDKRLARIQQTKPEARKARRLAHVNFVTFIDSIVADKQSTEEKFSNLAIDTDGEIASVSFDYAFLAGGKETNWGKEMWQLVRTEKGWKITSVIFSVRDPVAP